MVEDEKDRQVKGQCDQASSVACQYRVACRPPFSVRGGVSESGNNGEFFGGATDGRLVPLESGHGENKDEVAGGGL